MCGGGYIKENFTVWTCCILWQGDSFFHNSTEWAIYYFDAQKDFLHVKAHLKNSGKIFDLSCGIVDTHTSRIFLSLALFTLTFPAHSFALNWLSHLSLSRLPPHCGGSPLNRGPIILPLESRPFSLMQAAQPEVSTCKSHFNQTKLSLGTFAQILSKLHPPIEEWSEQFWEGWGHFSPHQ